MAEDSEDLELIKMLDLPAGAAVDERLRRWARAFESWLHERRAGCHRTVELRSRLAWREFLALTQKPPWQAGPEAVNAYASSLQARGLRPYTISSRLTALSNFYSYCQQVGVDAQCQPGFNPVKAVQRPKIVEYLNARSLSPKEEAALLVAIQRDASPIGKRDYALILALLRTVWKSVKVRELRWGDWERRFAYWRLGAGETWRRADGETQRLGEGESGETGEELPVEVGEAIRDYLEASGRLDGIRDEEYVFAPLSNPLVSESQDRAEDWDGGRPLSANHLRTLVKQHAHLAG